MRALSGREQARALERHGWQRVRTAILEIVAVTLACAALCADEPRFRVAPDEVLVVFNDTFPDNDRNGKSDSRDVAEYYARRRGVPLENLLPLDLRGPKGELLGEDYPDFYERVLTPVYRKLESHAADGRPFKDRIVYIVVCYGLPMAINVHLDSKQGENPFREGASVPWSAARRSLDQWLIDVDANFAAGYDKTTGKPGAPAGTAGSAGSATGPTTRPMGARLRDVRHPELMGLSARPPQGRHFKELKRTSPRMFPYYLVARLGTSPAVAAGQVDGALYAERYLRLSTGEARDQAWQPRIVLDHQPGFGATDHVAALARLAAVLRGAGQPPLFSERNQGLLRPWPILVDSEVPEIGEPTKDGTPHRPALAAKVSPDGVDTAGRVVRLALHESGRLKVPGTPYWGPGLSVTSSSGGRATVVGLDLAANALRLSTVEGFKPGDTIAWRWDGVFPIDDCFFYYCFYGLGKRWDCYRFLPGAIGVHVDSSCMNWATHQLTRGLSVAFGVVTEPFSSGIPYMDQAWPAIATGHDVCASLYAGLYANTRWAGVLFADPLYAPFRSEGLRDTTPPVVVNVSARAGRPGELTVTAELADRTADERAEIALFRLECWPASAAGRPAAPAATGTAPRQTSPARTVDFFDWPEPARTDAVRGRRYQYARRFEHTLTGLEPDAAYRLRVTARDPNGNEGYSADLTARTTGRLSP